MDQNPKNPPKNTLPSISVSQPTLFFHTSFQEMEASGKKVKLEIRKPELRGGTMLQEQPPDPCKNYPNSQVTNSHLRSYIKADFVGASIVYGV